MTTNVPTYRDLAEASGKLDRAARYLLTQYVRNENDCRNSEGFKLALCSAMGILSGLAYAIAPQKVGR